VSKNTREHWEERYRKEDNSARWSSEWRLSFYEWATQHIHERNGTFLDVGSGLGYGLQRVCKAHPGWQPTGLDFAWAAVSEAVIPTLHMDVLKDDIPGIYDYVLCIQTLEHFSCPDLVIRKMSAAAGKQLVITVPYREDISHHTEHESSFSEDYFYQFGRPWFEIQYNRLKVVYEFTISQRIIHRLKSYLRRVRRDIRW
jgi:hypothetical protein